MSFALHGGVQEVHYEAFVDGKYVYSVLLLSTVTVVHVFPLDGTTGLCKTQCSCSAFHSICVYLYANVVFNYSTPQVSMYVFLGDYPKVNVRIN